MNPNTTASQFNIGIIKSRFVGCLFFKGGTPTPQVFGFGGSLQSVAFLFYNGV